MIYDSLTRWSWSPIEVWGFEDFRPGAKLKMYDDDWPLGWTFLGCWRGNVWMLYTFFQEV